MDDERSRLLRAVLRTATTWGAAWALAGGALMAAVGLFDPDPRIESLPERLGMALFAGVAWGVRFGVIGAAMGTLFAALVRLRYRGRRLAAISPARFAALGAVIGGVGVPLFLQAMNVLSGDGPIAWRLVTDDAAWAAAFGAAAAGGSILLARRAEARAAGTGVEALGAADHRELPAPQPRATPLPRDERVTRR